MKALKVGQLIGNFLSWKVGKMSSVCIAFLGYQPFVLRSFDLGTLARPLHANTRRLSQCLKITIIATVDSKFSFYESFWVTSKAMYNNTAS